jgi:uncharacterized membrane protein YbhN (UPF0104 family)
VHGTTVLRLAITLALLGVLAFVVADPRELADAIAGLSGPALVVALGLTAGDRVLMAGKWWMLLRARGVASPFTIAVRAYFASSFAGLFLPVTLGADAIRVLAIRRLGVPDVTASVVVERTLGVLGMLAVALLSCVLLARHLADTTATALFLGLGAMTLGVVILFPLSLWLASRRRRWPRMLPAALDRVADAYAAYAQHPVTLAVFVALSVVESLIPPVTTYVLARGLGFDAPLWLFLATVPIALSVARLPISLGGFGVQEVSFVYLAGLVGMSAPDAIATMLVADAVLLMTLLPAAFDTSMLNVRQPPA